MRILKTFIFIGILVNCYGCSKGEKVKSLHENPGEVYISSVIERLKYSESIIDNMARAVDEAAVKLVKGGRIFITDDESFFLSGKDEDKLVPGSEHTYNVHENSGGFVAEACDRAGGLGFIKPAPLNEEITERDVVLVGTLEINTDAQLKQLNTYKDNGSLLILFGSADSKAAGLADYIIDNGLEPGLVPVMNVGENETVGPVAGIANVINMWVFTSELVAALTRQGKMPFMWQSMFVPGAFARNDRVGNVMLNPDLNIKPIGPGILGRQYINNVQGFLKMIKTNELTKFSEAGKLCAETISEGNNVVTSLIGHFMSSQRRMPGFPKIFTIREHESATTQLEGIVDKDDVWLHVGYSYYPEKELKSAQEIGVKTICVFTPGPSHSGEGDPVEADMSLINIYIDPYWKHGDAVVEVPGYDIKIIPPSGVVMITCYWMLIGETMKELTSIK